MRLDAARGGLGAKSGGRGCPTELKLGQSSGRGSGFVPLSSTPRYLLTGGAADLKASPLPPAPFQVVNF